MSTALERHLLDIAERAGATFAEAVLGALTAAHSIGLSDLASAGLAGVASLLAILRAAVLPSRPIGSWVEDVLLRAAFTFAQTLAGGVIIGVTGADLSGLHAAMIAAEAAVLAVVKAALLRPIGKPGSASALPAALDPTQVTAPLAAPTIGNVHVYNPVAGATDEDVKVALERHVDDAVGLGLDASGQLVIDPKAAAIITAAVTAGYEAGINAGAAA